MEVTIQSQTLSSSPSRGTVLVPFPSPAVDQEPPAELGRASQRNWQRQMEQEGWWRSRVGAPAASPGVGGTSCHTPGSGWCQEQLQVLHSSCHSWKSPCPGLGTGGSSRWEAGWEMIQAFLVTPRHQGDLSPAGSSSRLQREFFPSQ